MMTIEEAITRERELAERNRRYCEKYKGLEHVTYYNPNCLKYAEEHEQYAEWLEELSRRRVEELFRKTNEKAIRDKAIDDVLEILKRYNVPFNCDANYEILQLRECGSND